MISALYHGTQYGLITNRGSGQAVPIKLTLKTCNRNQR